MPPFTIVLKMKTKLLLFALICSATTLFSQSRRFHGNIGFTISQIDGDDIGGYKKLGYNLGAGFLFKKSDTYEIDYTLRINRRGARENVFYNISLDYVDNDISFNYVHKDFFFVGGGLGLGYLATRERRISSNITYARLDLFPLLTLGVKAKENLRLQTRFTRSLLPITVGGLRRDGFRNFNRSIIFELVWLMKNK